MAVFGTHGWARVLGFVAGVAAVAALVAGWQVGRGTGTVGADVTFVAAPTGELGIPTGPFVKGVGLTPGADAKGTVKVHNQTGRTLAVSVKVLPSIGDLDRVLQVRMTAGHHEVYDGPLGGLRDWSHPFRLASGAGTKLGVRIALPAGSDAASHGRIDDVSLAFRSVVVGGAQ
ncbi:MAG TPA: hypothetical protein VNN79_21420 [Actinomycetota bacterium]|nr:hypothetical protein [Actinomycetota bacterium]